MLLNLGHRLVIVTLMIPAIIAVSSDVLTEPSEDEIIPPRLYQPFLYRPDGITLYNNGSKRIALNSNSLPSGSFSVAFFGATNAGKSRLIEVLTQQPRFSISKSPQWSNTADHTQKMAFYDAFQKRSDLSHHLYMIDTPGLGLRSLTSLQKAISTIHDVQRFLESRPDAPQTRLYFVIDVASRQHENIVKMMELLKKAFGDVVASQIQIVLTKSELRQFLLPEQWYDILFDVKSFFKKVFPDSVAVEPIIVSAETGFGQLLEDLSRAAPSSNLHLDETNSGWCVQMLHELNQVDESRARFGTDLSSIEVEISLVQSQLQDLATKRNQIQEKMEYAESTAAARNENDRDEAFGSDWDRHQWLDAFNHVKAHTPAMNANDEAKSDLGLKLYLYTMDVARENSKFAQTYMRQFHSLEYITDNQHRTIKAWQMLESLYHQVKDRSDRPSVADLNMEMAHIDNDISVQSNRLSEMQHFAELCRLLESFLG